MWMKYDQSKGNTNEDGPNEAGLLRCPMCKGRGYFEPSQVTAPKKTGYFVSEQQMQSNSAVKLPSLQTKPKPKPSHKQRFKYSLPSINKVKNQSDTLSKDLAQNDDYADLPNRRECFEQINNIPQRKPGSCVKKSASRGLSVASSADSSFEKNLMPTPRTPKNPSETLKVSLTKLKSSNWNEGVNALKEIIQISRFQPHLLEPCMTLIYRGLIVLLKSFRSLVVRTACQAANELFAAMANTQRPEFDEVIHMLLQKTADTNKVVRQDANEALDTMVINIPVCHSVRTIVLKGTSHKSPLVRTASARLLVCAVGIVGVEAIFNGNKETRGRVVNAAAMFMQDGCQEARNFGKRLMKMLMKDDEFENVLQTEVNEVLLKRIEKAIVTMKYKT